MASCPGQVNALRWRGGAVGRATTRRRAATPATMIVWRRSDTGYTLLLAPDLAQAIARRLAMFVLRAKVALTPSARTFAGVLGTDAARVVASIAGAPAGGRGAVWHSIEQDALAILPLPDGRYLVDANGPLPGVIGTLPAADPSLGNWCGVRAGVPVVTAATSDKLVAQSANWELVGGVDFRKGCYPGQEIIARMQYLGLVRRSGCAGFMRRPPASPKASHSRTARPASLPAPWSTRPPRLMVAPTCSAVVHNDALEHVTTGGVLSL